MYAGDLLPLNKKMKESASSLRSCSMYESDSAIEAFTSSSSRFEDLNLSPGVLKGLYEGMKFEMPCKIQSMTLPIILTPPYKNVFTRTGHGTTGKTTCLVLAMLTRVDPNLAAPQALLLCPTTKYAIQIIEVIKKMEKFTGITSELCPDYIPDINKRAPLTPPLTAQVIIGSLMSVDMWIARKKLGTSNFKMVVFDEADHMLGPLENNSLMILKEIVRWSPKCQVLVFSHSYTSHDETVKAFVSTIAKDVTVREFHQLFVEEKEPLLSFDSVNQYNVDVLDEPLKIRVIKDKILELGDGIRQTVIYVGTRESAGILHQALYKGGYAVTTILDQLTLEDQQKKNKEFKDGLIQVLITRGLSSRGIDLSQVNLVINYDLPVKFGFHGARLPHHEAYLSILGRAGQFGRKAALFNFICGDGDRMIMEKIASHSNYRVTELPSTSSDDDFKDALKKAGLMSTGL